MNINPSWKKYFAFSRKERNVVITGLIAFVSFCFFLVFYNPGGEQPVIKNLDDQIAQLSSQNNRKDDSLGSDVVLADVASSSDETVKPASALFTFDPNTLDEAGFQRLGLRNKIIHTILNYRSKGGRFYKPEDLRKIYGLKPEEADRLIPYVRIDASERGTNYAYQNDKNKTQSEFIYNKTNPKIIDINTATNEQWKSLPAIGDVLSNRIVKYRDQIGGFTSVGQVRKVYGLSDSAYKAILPYLSFSSGKMSSDVETKTASPQKININTASASEIKINPVISSDIATAIVVYRNQHGKYSSVADIKKIVFINDELYLKIAPYLTVE